MEKSILSLKMMTPKKDFDAIDVLIKLANNESAPNNLLNII